MDGTVFAVWVILLIAFAVSFAVILKRSPKIVIEEVKETQEPPKRLPTFSDHIGKALWDSIRQDDPVVDSHWNNLSEGLKRTVRSEAVLLWNERYKGFTRDGESRITDAVWTAANEWQEMFMNQGSHK